MITVSRPHMPEAPRRPSGKSSKSTLSPSNPLPRVETKTALHEWLARVRRVLGGKSLSLMLLAALVMLGSDQNANAKARANVAEVLLKRAFERREQRARAEGNLSIEASVTRSFNHSPIESSTQQKIKP